VHPDLLEEVHPLHRDGKRLLGEGDVVLRYSVWSKTATAALSTTGKVALVYHNITPGHYLRDYNPTLADLCDRGREALPEFRGKVHAAVADSSFNAQDLEHAGVDGATVVPLLLELPADAPSRRANEAEPLVLSVGRIVPNKRLEDVIKAFALYQRHRAPAASLVLVGAATGFENYRHALDRLVERIDVERVFFTGPISAEARDAWYARADAYLSMSVHEGFCAPLIEAFAHGAPVVARGAGAVPETLGGAGLELDVEDDLPVAAEALHELVSSRETREALGAAARRRLVELRRDALAPRIRSALAPLLGAR
jgi:glycosyltransferase involved in cell wall biosynthesis